MCVMALDREIQAWEDMTKNSVVCEGLKDVCCIGQYQSPKKLLLELFQLCVGDVGGLSHR